MKSPDWKKHADEIRKILISEWDPIGCGVPDDEYDMYIPEIYLLLQARVDVTELADHLETLETKNMGLTGNPLRNRRVAEMLLRVMK